jgi:acyl-ACP thioesterase
MYFERKISLGGVRKLKSKRQRHLIREKRTERLVTRKLERKSLNWVLISMGISFQRPAKLHSRIESAKNRSLSPPDELNIGWMYVQD